jgi:hypothetical protein
MATLGGDRCVYRTARFDRRAAARAKEKARRFPAGPFPSPDPKKDQDE